VKREGKSAGEPAFCSRHSCESRNPGIARESGHLSGPRIESGGIPPQPPPAKTLIWLGQRRRCRRPCGTRDRGDWPLLSPFSKGGYRGICASFLRTQESRFLPRTRETTRSRIESGMTNSHTLCKKLLYVWQWGQRFCRGGPACPPRQ
jgi:hypothetical protein